MKKLYSLGGVVCAAAALMTANPAQAAVLFDQLVYTTTNHGAPNVLTGIDNLKVGSNYYNVTFNNGGCSANYSSCTIGSTFEFSQSAANSVADVLESVLDTAGVTFNANKVKGCTGAGSGACNILITFAVTNGGNSKPVFNYDAITIAGNSTTGSATYSGMPTLGTKGTNGGELKGVNYTDAVFTQVSLPEPATWAMMLVGFAMVGYAMRTRRSVSIAM